MPISGSEKSDRHKKINIELVASRSVLDSRRSNSSRNNSFNSRKPKNTLDYSFTKKNTLDYSYVKNKFRSIDSTEKYETKNRKVYDSEYL